MHKVVLDTNVIVSALLFGGNPDKILNLANERVIRLIISPFILDETANVLNHRFNWSEEKIHEVLSSIQEIAAVVQPTIKLSIIKEKDSDNRILECAVSGKADFIISGDNKHILPLKEYQGIKILSPAEFLALGF
jgi:putative PIN family toxin of toxin-antitoxin system